MFKNFFKKTPRPEDLTLSAIRERLLPLGFEESYDSQYHQSEFLRDNYSVSWNINLKDEHFYLILKEQDNVITTLNSPWFIKIDETKWAEFKDRTLKALDDWLKTI